MVNLTFIVPWSVTQKVFTLDYILMYNIIQHLWPILFLEQSVIDSVFPAYFLYIQLNTLNIIKWKTKKNTSES